MSYYAAGTPWQWPTLNSPRRFQNEDFFGFGNESDVTVQPLQISGSDALSARI
jgi:hypothetical protein